MLPIHSQILYSRLSSLFSLVPHVVIQTSGERPGSIGPHTYQPALDLIIFKVDALTMAMRLAVEKINSWDASKVQEEMEVKKRQDEAVKLHNCSDFLYNPQYSILNTQSRSDSLKSCASSNDIL